MHIFMHTKVLKIKVVLLYLHVPSHGYDMHICAFAFLNIRRYNIYITLFIYIGVIELLSKRNLMCVRLETHYLPGR